MNRRAKIVCTLGPAVDGPDRIRELVAAGMDVARLNFSHGDHAEHQQRHNWVREAAAAMERPVGILADLQGPKIRLGRFADRAGAVGHRRDRGRSPATMLTAPTTGSRARTSSFPRKSAPATGC